MNNKGFTTVEVIVSFALVVIVMASMTSMLVSYRDTISTEEVKTRLIEFKNSMTYMIYEDIVYNGIDSIRYCNSDGSGSTNGKCVDFIRDGEKQYRLELIDNVQSTGTENEKVYKTFLDYRGIRIMLPDSDLNKIEYKLKPNGQVEKDSSGNPIIDKSKQVSVIYDFLIPSDNSEMGITSLTIPFEHHGIDYRDQIKIIVAK